MFTNLFAVQKLFLTWHTQIHLNQIVLQLKKLLILIKVILQRRHKLEIKLNKEKKHNNLNCIFFFDELGFFFVYCLLVISKCLKMFIIIKI